MAPFQYTIQEGEHRGAKYYLVKILPPHQGLNSVLNAPDVEIMADLLCHIKKDILPLPDEAKMEGFAFLQKVIWGSKNSKIIYSDEDDSMNIEFLTCEFADFLEKVIEFNKPYMD
jgi:hypothetical protein